VNGSRFLGALSFGGWSPSLCGRLGLHRLWRWQVVKAKNSWYQKSPKGWEFCCRSTSRGNAFSSDVRESWLCCALHHRKIRFCPLPPNLPPQKHSSRSRLRSDSLSDLNKNRTFKSCPFLGPGRVISSSMPVTKPNFVFLALMLSNLCLLQGRIWSASPGSQLCGRPRGHRHRHVHVLPGDVHGQHRYLPLQFLGLAGDPLPALPCRPRPHGHRFVRSWLERRYSARGHPPGWFTWDSSGSYLFLVCSLLTYPYQYLLVMAFDGGTWPISSWMSFPRLSCCVSWLSCTRRVGYANVRNCPFSLSFCSFLFRPPSHRPLYRFPLPRSTMPTLKCSAPGETKIFFFGSSSGGHARSALNFDIF
jgi:hypothetical protein